MIRLDPLDARDRMGDYLSDVAQIDLATGRPAAHDPEKMLALIASLARNEATSASASTLIADTANAGGPADRDTVGRYINRLVEAFVIEPLSAWSAHLRSRATLRTKPRRFFADPSMAAAAVRATPQGLLDDPRTFGLLFESMAMRDLRVYAQSFGAEVRYYRDSAGHEVDAIITRGHRDWAAAEIKLGGPVLVERGIEALRRLRSNVDTDLAGEPRRLIVITATGPAYQTKDAIAVVPINHLAP